MLFRLLVTGLISGVVAGIVGTIFYLLMVGPLILEAEKLDVRATIVASPMGPPLPHTLATELNHSRNGGKPLQGHDRSTKTHVHHEGSTHTHKAWAPDDGLQRSTLTLIANVIVGIAFGILLATGLTLYGQTINWIEGMGWGISGFLSFSLLPALGLPPELPGSVTAELFPRQVWWLSTAFSSAIGIALFVFNSLYIWKTTGIAVLIAPHLIGAPNPQLGAVGSVPPELAAQFVVNTLFLAAVMWLILGITSSYVLRRLDANENSSLQTET